MASDSTRSFSHFQSQAELELMQLVLDDSNTPYPWNPFDPNAYAYFEQLEQEVVAAGWTPEQLAPYTATLSTQVNTLWAAIDAERSPASPSVDLFQQIASRLPQALLQTIVQRSQQLAVAQGNLADQMVACVQGLLEWGEEDLQVLARPFAYAMRSTNEAEQINSVLQPLQDKSWEQLSSVEQARLSLVVARLSLTQAAAEGDR